MKMTRKPDCIETGGATLETDEETGKPYWSLWGADWKDGVDMEEGEAMQLSPHAFPPGTQILVIEPGPDSKVSQDFYEGLLRQNEESL